MGDTGRHIGQFTRNEAKTNHIDFDEGEKGAAANCLDTRRVSLSAAVVFAYTGKVWVRFNGWVYRAQEPKWFWWEVALDYLIGVCFIGCFLFTVAGFSK